MPSIRPTRPTIAGALAPDWLSAAALVQGDAAVKLAVQAQQWQSSTAPSAAAGELDPAGRRAGGPAAQNGRLLQLPPGAGGGMPLSASHRWRGTLCGAMVLCGQATQFSGRNGAAMCGAPDGFLLQLQWLVSWRLASHACGASGLRVLTCMRGLRACGLLPAVAALSACPRPSVP